MGRNRDNIRSITPGRAQNTRPESAAVFDRPLHTQAPNARETGSQSANRDALDHHVG